MNERDPRRRFPARPHQAPRSFPLAGLVPESRLRLAARRTPESPAPQVDIAVDHGRRDLQAALAIVQATPEYRRFQRRLVSESPLDYWQDLHSGLRLLSLAVQPHGDQDRHAREKPALTLYQTLAFALDPALEVVDVFLVTPEVDAAIETEGLSSTIEGLRSKQRNRARHNAVAQTKIKAALRIADESNARARQAQAAHDCDVSHLQGQSCNREWLPSSHFLRYESGGGSIDPDGQFWCVAGCGALVSWAARAACAATCRYVICWTPPYSYCVESTRGVCAD